MDRDQPQQPTARVGEAVRYVGRSDDDVAGGHDQLPTRETESRLALLDDEYLSVGMAMQLGPHARQRMDDDDRERDVTEVRTHQLVRVLGVRQLVERDHLLSMRRRRRKSTERRAARPEPFLVHSSGMGKLIYGLNVSLDGFVETPEKSLDWAAVDDELHQWFNDRFRTLDASLYGRGIYELMSAHWPTAGDDPQATDVVREFSRIWLDTPKIVFSSTLENVDWNSRLVRGDIGDELVRLRQEFQGDMEVAGATLAGSFVRRGLIDEYHLVVHPVAIGSGTPFFPPTGSPIRLRLKETHVFSSGVTYLAYVPAS